MRKNHLFRPNALEPKFRSRSWSALAGFGGVTSQEKLCCETFLFASALVFCGFFGRVLSPLNAAAAADEPGARWRRKRLSASLPPRFSLPEQGKANFLIVTLLVPPHSTQKCMHTPSFQETRCEGWTFFLPTCARPSSCMKPGAAGAAGRQLERRKLLHEDRAAEPKQATQRNQPSPSTKL